MINKINCIDFFCGAGGASFGLESSKHVSVVAAINHDPYAIECHSWNHPHTEHYNDDIRKVNALELAQKHPNTKAFWWSAECTHQSNAKGGAPRDADSRMMNFELMRFMDAFPDLEYIFIENVSEFKGWGPLTQKHAMESERENIMKKGFFLDDAGMCWKDESHEDPYLIPDKSRKGDMHFRWIRLIENRGFRYEWRILNCADFGAKTSRPRYYGIAVKNGLPLKWPRKTHSKNAVTATMFNPNPLKKWESVKDVLDLENVGKSIFDRKKPLSPNTIARIQYGLNKFFPAKNGEPYILRYPEKNEETNGIPEGNPICGLESDSFVVKQNSQEYQSHSIYEPLHTITTIPRSQLTHCFLTKYYSTGANVKRVGDPLPTITTKDRFALVNCPMILPYSYKANPRELSKPLCTICAKRDKYICFAQFIEKMYRDKYNVQSVEDPLHTITTVPKFRMISGLIVDNRILDIRMRMLTVPELLAAQGFPSDYKMPKSATRAKKFIGNSVPPNMVELLTHAQFGTEEQRISGVNQYHQTA